MPTIMQITIDGNMGSTGRIAEAIGNLAIARGWESYIAHGRFTRPSESKIIKIGSDTDVFAHGLQTRLFDRHGLGSKLATIKFVNQIKTINPDVIHLHSLHGYYINMKVLFNYLSKTSKPVIWTFHDCWSITGHCCHFDFVECDKWKTECHHCPQKREYPASFFLDRSRENYRLKKVLFTSVPNMTVVSVSNWLNGIVSESFMGHIPRQMIYNGIDINIFTPVAIRNKIKEKLNIGDGFMIFGVAGIWHRQKGLSDFIKLSKSIGKNNFIVLVGLNKSQIRKLPSNIIGITRTENQEELKDLYATADVFLNLSVEESFGLTIAESLSCGTPAIVYNATACPELVNIDTGIVVKKNDINGVLNAIETVRKKGKAFYSAACRARAVKYFNKNERFTEYVDLYEKMMISKPNNDESSSNSDFIFNNFTKKSSEKINPKSKYKICSNCIMDTSDPKIIFDERGWCDYCRNYYKNILPNWFPNEKGERMLMPLIERIKKEGKGRDHDCLIGLSGGVDSSYVTWLAKEKFGLRPMLFHVDAGWNSQEAVNNIQRLVDGLSLELYTEVVNWEEIKDLQVAFFKAQVPHIDTPQDHAFFAALYNFAAKNKYKYILTGANYATECVREPLEWHYHASDLRQLKDIHHRFGKRELKTFPLADIFKYKIYYRFIKRVQVVKPLNHIRYIKEEAMQELVDRFGWQKYPYKHYESRFTRFYEGYWLPEKFGYQKHRAHFSSLILTGQMTREEALAKIAKPAYDQETIMQDFEYIAKKLDLSVEELKEMMMGENKTYRDYKNNMFMINLATQFLRLVGVQKSLIR